MTGLLKRTVRRLLPALLWFLRLCTPTINSVVVAAFPATEANAVETVRALLQHYRGKVVWLDGPSIEWLSAEGPIQSDVHKLRVLPKASIRGIGYYLCSSAVFVTHGIYGLPRVVRRKPTIYLGHGEAIKRCVPLFPSRLAGGKPVDFIVGNTRRFAPLYNSVGAELLLSGYPRNDAIRRPASDAMLERLSIDPTAPFVLWMPSFRQSKRVSLDGGYIDTTDVSKDEDLATMFERGASELTKRGIQLVIKPHPIDAVARGVSGATVIDDNILNGSRVGLYELMGRAAGLITDASSVGIDFLLLDRPIAYFFPDLEEYSQRRGLWPEDVLDHLPGPFLVGPEDFKEFARQVLGESSRHDAQREQSVKWVGVLKPQSCAVEMLRLLRRATVDSILARGLEI